MDGAEGVLGIGGPIFVRKGSNLTSVGVIQIDNADVGLMQLAGIMETTITHEMVHILGFSTYLWRLEGKIFPSASCVWDGKNAVREYKAISGCDAVPLTVTNDNTCGAHWDENCLGTEIMSPKLGYDEKFAPVSRVTIGLLEDVGYNKPNYAAADKFGEDDLGDLSWSCKGRRQNREQSSSADEYQGVIHRSLSTEKYEYAVDYGRSILEQRKLDPGEIAQYGHRDGGPEETVYVGDRMLSVLVQENDEIYSVVVSRS